MTKEQVKKLDSIPSGGGGGAILEGNVTGPLDATLVVKIQDITVDLTGHAAGEALIFNPANNKIIPSNNPAGSVMSVSASAPLASSGGANPNISIVPGTVIGQVIRWNGAQWEAALLFQNPTTSVPTAVTLGAGDTPVLAASARLGLVVYNKSTDKIAIIVLGASAVDGTQMIPIGPQSQWTDLTGWQGLVTGSGGADIVATELFA